jgi:gas vesicle protein
MNKFLLGLSIGVGLGILFAPMSGEETRRNLSDRANDLAESARETFEEGRERIRSGISSVRRAGDRAAGELGRTGTEPAL